MPSGVKVVDGYEIALVARQHATLPGPPDGPGQLGAQPVRGVGHRHQGRHRDGPGRAPVRAVQVRVYVPVAVTVFLRFPRSIFAVIY